VRGFTVISAKRTELRIVVSPASNNSNQWWAFTGYTTKAQPAIAYRAYQRILAPEPTSINYITSP